MNGIEIAAVVLGSLAGIILLIFLYFYFTRRRKQRTRRVAQGHDPNKLGTTREGMVWQDELERLREENRYLLEKQKGNREDDLQGLQRVLENTPSSQTGAYQGSGYEQTGGLDPTGGDYDLEGPMSMDPRDGSLDPTGEYYDLAPF